MSLPVLYTYNPVFQRSILCRNNFFDLINREE